MTALQLILWFVIGTPVVVLILRFLQAWEKSLIEYDVQRYERKGKK